MSSLIFSEIELGRLVLRNRFVMAPMTRCRSSQPGDIPNELMAKYYSQRADHTGLIISEASQISAQGKGYSRTPGIFTKEQTEGWKKTTELVHKKGSKIFLQLWHVGRMSHESFHEDRQTVGPSSIKPNARVWVIGEDGVGKMIECPIPLELTKRQIRDIISNFRLAARNAIEAGFDGVEIHGANGYLIDQFLRRSSNLRRDDYGGSIENRTRFAYEVAEAVSDEVGNHRTGIRLSPFIKQRGMDDEEAIDTILSLSKRLDQLGLIYIHLAEADWDDAPDIDISFRQKIRQVYRGRIIVAGNYSTERGERLINSGLVDLIAFGRPYIANPDFPIRIKNGWGLADYDPNTLFGGAGEGYTSYQGYTQKSDQVNPTHF
ncbi:alkene reductase [Pseudobacteriovorax antillogorgiicola]|uniref:N-ethylmaleimide reductase n=1 Tax=Pseudobacteriovorax antillogorgiicola TaxID=1513793 RepID=A0A1Y6C879_9BACT|nr:alkene reductase [Pseudobacteriovorax antillogorgiicola]TCS50755.1 N-ethylmaleimide reductase [Pseudobacteriovorax antillogorgiicola]SMF41132.1 N-ethylmaleimide reductase [Pseudobacteriovorax antillogorgiicola]